IFFFFFQAEDGIRDYKVTGVQTCALPISSWPPGQPRVVNAPASTPTTAMRRSEERREGKSVDLGGRRIIKKKKQRKKIIGIRRKIKKAKNNLFKTIKKKN